MSPMRLARLYSAEYNILRCPLIIWKTHESQYIFWFLWSDFLYVRWFWFLVYHIFRYISRVHWIMLLIFLLSWVDYGGLYILHWHLWEWDSPHSVHDEVRQSPYTYPRMRACHAWDSLQHSPRHVLESNETLRQVHTKWWYRPRAFL